MNVFSYMSEKMKNQVRNEIFRQLSLALTLPLGIPVRPMDAKGLISLEDLQNTFRLPGCVSDNSVATLCVLS